MNKLMIGGLTAACFAIVSAGAAQAATVSVGVDPTKMTNGFINVSDLPSDGGAYRFGTSFGTGDLRANVVGPTLVLEACYPPGIASTDAYWFKPGTSLSGVVGNKIVDANYYAQSDALAGSTITFSGVVLSHTLNSGYASTAFIKAFAPDYSSNTGITVPLNPGPFSITFAAPVGTHVQYGLETIGAAVYQTDIAAQGNVILALPEPASLTAVGALGMVGMIRRRRA